VKDKEVFYINICYSVLLDKLLLNSEQHEQQAETETAFFPTTISSEQLELKRENTCDAIVHSSRPKRMRKEPVESKLRRVQPLEKISNGQYKLPARVGIITVHSLGRIIPIPTYHNDRYIWPPGFKISRYLFNIYKVFHHHLNCVIKRIIMIEPI
jgi:hypothetical protein